MVSRSLASAVWGERDPIGRTFRIARDDPWYVVAGVVGDVHNGSFESPLSTIAVYERRTAHSPIWSFQSLIVRTTGDTPQIERAIRELVKQLHPNVPVTDVATASALIVDINARVQFATWLMIVFSGIATLLALTGVYGSFSCAVRQRTREIAVRLALGAERHDVIRMVLTTSARCALAGVLVGVPVALGLTRMLKALLFATSASDPLTYFTVSVTLVVAALGAAWFPARRASRLDPAHGLRAD